MKIKILLFTIFATRIVYAADILFIGDSHSVGLFGREFDKLLRQDERKIETYAVCGSTLKWWFEGKETRCGYFFRDENGVIKEGYTNPQKTPLLTELIKKTNPQLIIVQLGTNWWNEKEENIQNEIKRFFEIIENKECYWIGPPKSRKLYLALERINKLLSETISQRCVYFDSLAVTDYPNEGGDGIHYSSNNPLMKEIAIRWANSAYKFYFNPQ